MLESSLHQSFVSPSICIQLLDAGLNIKAPFCWHVLGTNKFKLFSLAFDEDSYYTASYNAAMQLNAISLVPAFQIMDMVKLLPDHLLNRNNNEYELSCSSLFSFEVEKGTRMPDVYAAMVLKGIQAYKINTVEAIKQITLTN